ncbi:hypothetical protein GC169_11865 [bacterium]|nr:hypothetical protein [bacterium]
MREARTRPHAAEIGLAVVGVLLFMEAFLPKLLNPDPMAGEDSLLLRMMWLPVYALVAAGLVAAGSRSVSVVLRSPWICLLTLLAVASTLWSILPDVTFRRSLALAATTAFGFYLAARYDWSTLLRILGAAWTISTALNVAAGVLWPAFGVSDAVHPGAWSGGWWEKNQLGGHMARSSLLFAFLVWRDEPWRRVWLAALAGALALVVLSQSVTALLGTLLGLGVVAIGWIASRGRTLAIIALWAAAVAATLLAAIALLDPGLLFSTLGRDATLTGRTDIWTLLQSAVWERPLTGYGYGAFWARASDERMMIATALEWNAPTAHSGWLDLALAVGLGGAAIFALDLAFSIWRGSRRCAVSPVGVFVLAAIGQLLLFGVSESLFLAQNSIVWATYVAISGRLALEAGPERAGQRAGLGVTPRRASTQRARKTTPHPSEWQV